MLARLLAEHIGSVLGRTVIVDNRTGGDGRIGVRAATQAPPDGRTILFSVIGTISIQPALYGNLPYDPLRDLAPVVVLGSSPLIMVVHPGIPVKSVPELVAWISNGTVAYSQVVMGRA
mgnify:CR=1 FL=1